MGPCRYCCKEIVSCQSSWSVLAEVGPLACQKSWSALGLLPLELCFCKLSLHIREAQADLNLWYLHAKTHLTQKESEKDPFSWTQTQKRICFFVCESASYLHEKPETVGLKDLSDRASALKLVLEAPSSKTAIYFPGAQNLLVDSLSSHLATDHMWKLHNSVMNITFTYLGTPSWDLFTTQMNKKFNIYCSRVAQDQDSVSDAHLQS